MKNLHGKTRAFGAVIGWGVVFVAALAVTVWAWRTVVQIRHQLVQQEMELSQLPETEAKALAVESDVAKRQLDIQRIESFLVTKDQLGGLVSEVIAAGQARGVAADVPTVEEKVDVDEDGKEKSEGGPINEVRLKITATGDPKNLLVFLHDLEHMQRLTYFESWRLDAGDTTAQNQAAALAPEAPSPALRGLLLADFIVAVRQEEAH